MSTMNHLIRNFKKYLSTSGRGVSTVNSYTSDLNCFARYLKEKNLSFKQVDLSHLKDFTDELSSHKHEKSNSIRRKIISVRQFYKFLSGTDIITDNPFLSSLIPERNEKLPELLNLKKIQRLFDVASKHQNSIKNARDLALLSLLSHEGLKVTELIELEWKDLILNQNLKGTLMVTGTKKRVIELLPSTCQFLSSYEKILSSQEDKSFHPLKSKAMFIAFKGPDLKNHLSKITRHGLKFLLYELGEEARISKLNTELLRHFAISSLLERFNDVQTVQMHLGLKKPGNILKHLAETRKNSTKKTN